MDKVLVDRELLEYLADLGDEAIERMGSYLAEKHGEQKYVDAARAILAQPAEADANDAERALSAVTAERDRLREQCRIHDMLHGTKGRERVAALLAKNEVLSKDAARLDWLGGYIVIAEHEDTGKFAFNSIKGALRECVDAAMAAKDRP